jgi:nitrogen fixation NifU-like protein
VSGAIYNERIVAAARAASGAGRLAAPDVTVECDNPLCGDRITLDLTGADGHIAALAHKTRGCLLTQAAASVLARHAAGATPDALRRARQTLEALLAGEPVEPAWPDLAMFAPVQAVKSRHECVLLPFDALAQALAELERRR